MIEAILLAVGFFLTGMVTAFIVQRRPSTSASTATILPPQLPPTEPLAPTWPTPQPQPEPAQGVGPAGTQPVVTELPPSLIPTLAGGRAPVFDLIRPDRLPTFTAVGGMDHLKKEMLDTVGLLVRHPDDAKRYRISWNGILLHGPPGVGKSFFARALAGELSLNLVPISSADLVTGRPGRSRVEAVFSFAAAHLPCMLLFDEFDAVAATREDSPDQRGSDVLTQLLSSLEEYHHEPRLLVVATTNEIELLDPAVTRPGRFDRVVRLDLPDAGARRAIFAAALEGRPVRPDVDLDGLAHRTQGMTPATIEQVVDAAAMAACRQAAGTGKVVRIGSRHLDRALDNRGGEDRPTVEGWSWGRLVLPPRTLMELKKIQALLSEPDEAAHFGIDPPAGVLLTGPPGTGKTTIAKVLAAESRCSFYPVSAADVTSRWVGESEQRIARLFSRARSNAPSIIFIDEIDAIASSRGELSTYDRQLDQLLQEIDGMGSQPGVLVVGATNRPQALDPALVRGGRLSRRIEIPSPDRTARRAILALLTQRMPLAGVDLDDLANETEGFSGGDLKSLCQQAALEAMVRQGDGETRVAVTVQDFDSAMAAQEHEEVRPRPRRR